MAIPEAGTATTAGPVHRCGTVAVVGRPNVGKSTLLNALVGERLSIAGPKPQTTRHRILGVATRADAQILLLDTPGLQRADGRAIGRQLNRTARQVLAEADIVLHVVEAGRWTDEDESVWQALSVSAQPRLLVLSKIDRIRDKTALLPFIAGVTGERSYSAVLPVSAKAGEGLAELERAIVERLPEGPAVYAADELTDRSERFLAAELIREQLMLRLSQELPYATTVEIEQFEQAEGRCSIGAVIWVERDGQKSIVIGAGGAQLKAIGTAARLAMQRLFGRRVFLRLWVKVRENWSDDEAALRRFGYSDP
jgi:GTP-binding protein Era